MVELGQNPFAVLTILAAPAILTNASSILALSTSNRVLRCMDRLRELAAQVKSPEVLASAKLRSHYMPQVDRVQHQCHLFLSALKLTYFALGAFSSATLIALLGAVFVGHWPQVVTTVAIVSLVCGIGGVLGLSLACINLVRASRLALQNMDDDARLLRELVRESPLPA